MCCCHLDAGGRLDAKASLGSGLVSNGDVVCRLTEPIDRQMYMTMSFAVLQYGRGTLSTAAMARYLIQTVGIQLHHRILFLGSGGTDDYQADTLLHGLHSIMSTPVVDWPRTTGLYADAGTFTEAELASARVSRYGGGFSFTYRIHEPFGINRTAVQHQLQDAVQHYEYVIFGVTHRGEWQKQGICGKMPRDRVVLVNGNDWPPSLADLRLMHACGSHIFLREMTPDCKQANAGSA